MQEVRARIQDMPGQCRLLVETGGAPIKSILLQFYMLQLIIGCHHELLRATAICT
jgi:hypothetical protein